MDQHGLHLPAKYLHRYVRQLDIEHRGDTRETRMAIHETTRYRQYVDEFNTAMAIFTYWHISKSWKDCLVTDQRLIPFHSPTLQLKFEFGSHLTAYMLEVTTGSRFCFENGLDTVIQGLGKHQIILDLQVTRENPSWRSICLVRFIFATLDAMACVPIEMCAARLQEIWSENSHGCSNTWAHFSHIHLGVFNLLCAKSSSTDRTSRPSTKDMWCGKEKNGQMQTN